MSVRLFGTDGMRGRVNKYPMTPEVALRLGLAAGTFYRDKNRRSRVVIGKDTRLSGYVFENALAAGLLAAGMDVFLVGPLPTPAISFLTTNMRADVGVVISASHNPFSDNGIKFFDAEGFKIPDADEDRMTEMVLDPNFDWNYPEPANTGRAYKIKDAPGRYIVYLKNSFPAHLSLEGLRVVIDCANGANYRVAPLALEELGAEVVKIGTEPNGLNINYRCGSLYPEAVAAKVRETRADIGLALDGDADRLIVVDEKGTVLDGDQIMALCAQDLMQQGKLPGNILVATVMSNMALEVFMKERGGTLIRTNVGDRHVVAAMRQQGALLGGEQSGHLNTAQPATVSLPLFRSCGSCASGGGLCRNSPACSSPIRRNSGTCTSNTRYRLRKTRKSPMPSPVSKKALKAVGVCCCVIRARNLCAGLWLKGRMRTRYACMPTSLPESWKKRSDRRVLRTVRVHGSAFSDGEGDIFILLFKKE